MRRLGLALGLICALWAAPVAAQPLTLSWDYPATPVLDNFTVHRAPASGTPLAPSGPFGQIASVLGTVKSYADASVVVGTAYCYQVRAVAGTVSSGPSNTACAVIPPGPSNLRLSLTIQDTSPNQSGKVNSLYAGIACPGDCTEDYAPGTPVYLAAIARGSTRFLGWSGACTGTTAWCQFVIVQPADVIARFGRR